MNRYWLARSVTAMWALHIPLIAWLEPESIASRVLAAGAPGIGCLAVLAGCALIALADVACNDFPRGNWFGTGLNHRHVGFMLMAALLVLLSGVLMHQIGWSAIVLAYWIPAFFSVVIVPLDLKARHGRQAQ